ncbi:FAS1 domain superfamily [Arabidopsis thaliana x Arabidopsis arenosa]|uniref:FAS1 domain superfamily n=1 Tax=Arabidopsis thaliana x Arabidopsis arenosa TaxID=1240361 RepID=A0A8T1YBA5_9BRAS|nr:FAS1 domain superfamily [Arabidopsis thaliana x Arabidopsis arenosa]
MGRSNFLLFAVFLIVGVASRTMDETAQEVIEALAHSIFDDWSPSFISTNNPLLGQVLPSTLFIPMSTTSSYEGGDKRKFAAYHLVPGKIDFTDILSKKDGSRLPTLLAGSFILISNSSSGLYLDGVQVIEPDVYVDSVMAIHRVVSPLDFAR